MTPTPNRPTWTPPATPNYRPPASPSGYTAAAAAPASTPAAFGSTPMTAAPPEAQFLRYANVGKRFLALLIDGIIIGLLEAGLAAVLYALAVGLGYVIGDAGGALLFGFGAWIVTPTLGLAIALIYFIKGETGVDQGTFGKRMMDIKVVNLYGGTLTPGQSAGRFICRFFSSLFFCLGYFLALFNDKRQTLHDMIAGTIVLER